MNSITLEKVENGFVIETKNRRKFVFQHFYEMWNWLEYEFDPKPAQRQTPIDKELTPL